MLSNQTNFIDRSPVRGQNLEMMLSGLRASAPLSRAALAEQTGLTRATVSSLVGDLLEARLVREIGLSLGSVGRPGVLLELNPEGGSAIGAAVGADYVSSLLTDFTGGVVWQRRDYVFPDTPASVVLELALDLVAEAARQARSEVLGLALGVPGLVDASSGRLIFSPSLGWRGVPLRDIFEAAVDFPVLVDNEANLAAFGEAFFGAGQGASSVLYVSAGVGLGSGIVLNGEVLRGHAGLAGEAGHMKVEPGGLLCSCGSRGCWETLASQGALFRRVRVVDSTGHQSALGGLSSYHLTVERVLEAARTGDGLALAAMRETAWNLGLGIANLVNVFNPERVVVGGALALAADFIMPVIVQAVAEQALPWIAEATHVLIAAHGRDSAVRGGAGTVLREALENPSVLVARRAPVGRGARL